MKGNQKREQFWSDHVRAWRASGDPGPVRRTPWGEPGEPAIQERAGFEERKCAELGPGWAKATAARSELRAARGERLGAGISRWNSRVVLGRTAGRFAIKPALGEVWIAVEPIDMRAGIGGLSLRIQEALGRSPCDGSAYAFRNRRALLAKYPHETVAVYLNAFNDMNEANWANLKTMLEGDARLQLGEH